MEIAGALPDQERRASVSHGRHKPWSHDSHLPEARHAERDKDGVGQAACETDRKDVRAHEALAQDKGVLRPNRDKSG
jgi:hypothetical protein